MDDIISVIFTYLPVDYCIRYQIVCKKWRQLLTGQVLWKSKCLQHWPNYPLNGITDYFKLFLDRGGAHFITEFKQFRRIYYEEVALGNKIRNLSHLTNHTPWEQNLTMEIKRNNGLRFMFTKCNMRCYEGQGHMSADRKSLFDNKANIDITKMDDYWSQIQRTIHHPNVYVPVRWFRNNNDLYFLHETMVENSFLDFLIDSDRFGELSEKKLAKVVKDLFLGAKQLSDRGAYILYPNLIFDAKDDWIEFKLFDFGFSFIGQLPLDGYLLSPPENGFLSYKNLESDAATSNIWTISSFLFQLLVGEHPYCTSMQTFRQYFRIESEGVAFPDDVAAAQELSAEVKDFIIKLYKMKPTDRMSMDDALTHPWMQAPPTTFLGEVFQQLSSVHADHNRCNFMTFENLIDADY